MASRIMTVDQAVEYVAQYHIVLAYNEHNLIEPFTAGGPKLPMAFKRSIYKHQAELAARMRAGDSRLCPTRFHRKWHRRKHGISYCLMCRQLDESMNNTYQPMAS